MPVAEQELLEIALGGTAKDEEEDPLPHEQHNRHERCLLRFGAQGHYCRHGHARGEEVPYQNLDLHSWFSRRRSLA